MSDDLPSLDDLPTQPPPPPPTVEPRNRRSDRLASRDSNSVTGSLGRLMVLLLTMHLALTAATYVVVLTEPPTGVALAVIVAGNAVWGWCLVSMLGMLGRGR